MRLSGLCLAVILLSVSVAFAQHGGGSSGGSSGASSGGGSHGGGGASSSSGGSSGHSSGGGSAGHSSSSSGHNSGSPTGGHSSNAASVPRTGTRTPSTTEHPIHEPNTALQAKAAPEKRPFFSFLHHPFRRPKPAALVTPHPPACLKGPCRVCPPGKVGRGCVVAPAYVRNECRNPGVWNPGGCFPLTPGIDTCDMWLREMQRQAQRVQAAQASEQNLCAQGLSQECSEATATRQQEERNYQLALGRYQNCRMGETVGFRFANRFPGFREGAWYDPFRLELAY